MRPRSFNTKNLGTGFLYFYIHFVTEAVSFYALANYTESVPVTWLIVFAYDMLAFVPQSVIGYISDKFPRFSFGLAGLAMLAAGLLTQQLPGGPFLSLVLICLGNACIHVNGAEVTLRTANGSLSHSAIFVSGGSFGVITGKLLGAALAPFWMLLILIASAIPFAILAQMYMKDANAAAPVPCRVFRYNNPRVNRYIVILLSMLVVTARGYMAYAIPTSWRKTTLQTILLFVTMGLGKALGGVFADLFGIKKTAMLSILLALPLLLFGDQFMFVSLIGVMFFSMTMSVTLAVIVSALPKTPGLSFGLTTIGLFLGAVPVFFVKISGFAANSFLLISITGICLLCLHFSIRKDKENERLD